MHVPESCAERREVIVEALSGFEVDGPTVRLAD